MIPGFRTRNPFKAALAIVGYALIGLMLLLGVVTMFPAITVLGFGALLVVMLAFDAGGVRRRVPGLGSENRLAAAGSWLLVLGLIVTAATVSDRVVFSEETLAARRADYDARAAERAAREAASTPKPTAALAPSPTPVPSPSPSATASPTPNPSLAATPSPIPTPISTPSAPPTTTPSATPPTPIDLARFIPPLDGYTQYKSDGGCSARRTSAGCLYFGPARPGATTAGASVSITLLDSAAEAASKLPDYMHHVDEAPVDLGSIAGTGAWRPSVGTVVDPSYMIGFTYGRLVIVIDVQRANSTRAVTMDWAKRFGVAYVSAISAMPKP